MGFVPYLLIHLKMLLEQNYTGTKITPSGFTKMLLENNPRMNITSIGGESISGMKLNTSGGQIRDVKFKYLPRITDDQIGDEDNCDNDFGFYYKEGQLETPLFSKGGFRLEWGFVEKYEAAAAQAVQTGNPNVPIMQEVADQIMHAVNGLIVNMDKKLLSQIAWGTNAATGNNAAKTINLNKSGDTFNLSDGVNEIISDTRVNEFAGSPLIVGSGLFDKYQSLIPAIGLNGGGVNRAAQQPYEYYFDLNAAGAPTLGTDQIGVFAKDSIGLVDIDRYVGFKTGKFGTSWFATITLPVENPVEGAAPVMMPFNLQVQEIDCPDEDFDGYRTRGMGRGYKVIISKRYGLFQQPTDAYSTGDRMNGANGALRYKITNDCDGCPEGAV